MASINTENLTASDILDKSPRSSQLDITLTRAQSAQLPGICNEWANNIKCVLFEEEEIQRKVKQLAQLISREYAGKKVLCVGLLTGCFVFLSDLLRSFTIPYQVDFMVVSSYGNSTTSSGSVKLKKDMSIDPAGRDILIIEDLIDTGNTLLWIKEHLKNKHCNSVRICCLLDKKARRTAPVAVDYIGFECPDEFVIGYGMDFKDEYRCLPWIGVLKPQAYQ
jgi:hypoxanthine phosphoribosyltransferase